MRALGLDFGNRTVGVAVSDPFGWTAQSVEVIRRKDENALKDTLKRISEICSDYGVNLIVLGYPKNMNNSEGDRCQKTLAFKEKLERHIKLPVVLRDERLSTVAAERPLLEADLSRAKRKEVIDKQAAVFILQGYLDSAKYRNNYDEVNEMAKDEEKDFNDLEIDDTDGDFEEDFEEELEVIVMTNDEGVEVEYLIIDEIEHKGEKYLLVVEGDKVDDEEADALIFKQVEEEGDEFVYEELTDEEFNEVAKILSERLDEYEIDF